MIVAAVIYLINLVLAYPGCHKTTLLLFPFVEIVCDNPVLINSSK